MAQHLGGPGSSTARSLICPGFHTQSQAPEPALRRPALHSPSTRRYRSGFWNHTVITVSEQRPNAEEWP